MHAKADTSKRASYAELIGGRYLDDKVKWNGRLGNGLALEVEAPLKKHTEYKVIGKSLPRRDLPGKVFGTLEMVNDVRLPGMMHARMIRPSVAGAVPVKVDEASIKDIPGAKVVWIKDLLAVVAEKEWNAVRAAKALKVTWSESKPNFPGHDKLFEHIRKAPIVKREFQRENGNFEDGIKQAVRVIEGEYEFPTQSHSSTGPACAVADVRDGAARLLEQLGGGAKKPATRAPAAAAARRNTKGRSGGVVDAPGKKHRKPLPSDPGAPRAASQVAKMRTAKTMVKTNRRRGRG